MTVSDDHTSKGELFYRHPEAARLFALYDDMLCGVAWYTYNNPPLFLNLDKKARENLMLPAGLTEKEVRRLNVFDFVHPDDKEEVIKAHLDLVKEGQWHQLDFRIVRTNGDIGYVNGRIKVYICEDGERIYNMVYFDHTSDHLNMLRLRDERLRYETLLNNIPCGVAVVEYADGNLYFRFLSQGFVKIIGNKIIPDQPYPLEYVKKRIRSGDSELMDNALSYLLTNKTQYEMEYEILNNDGNYIWVNNRLAYIEDVGGGSLAYSIFTDITANKKAEEEMAIQRDEVSFVIDSVNINIWEYDLATKIVTPLKISSLNNYLKDKSYQVLPDYALMNGLIREDCVNNYVQMYRDLTNGAKSAECEICSVDKGKEVWEHVRYNTLFDEGGKPYKALGSSVDITDYKRLVKRYNDELDYRTQVRREGMVACARVNLSTGEVEELYDTMYDAKNVKVFNEHLKNVASHVLIPERAKEMEELFCIQNLIREYWKGRESVSKEYQRISPDGSVIWTSTTAKVFEEPIKRELTAFYYSYDTTKEHTLKDIMAALVKEKYEVFIMIQAESAEIYRFLLKNSHGNDWQKSSYSRLNYEDGIKRFAKKIVLDEAERKKFLEEMSLKKVIAELNKNGTYSVLATVDFGNGEEYKKYLFSYMDNRRAEIILMRSDITQDYRVERERQTRLKEALKKEEQANTAKTQFISQISHEIRTPLNAIIGMQEIALQNIDNAGEVRECLGTIKEAATYLTSLFNQILEMSRAQTGKYSLNLKKTKIDNVINGIKAVCVPIVDQKGINFEEDINIPQGLTCYIDVTKTQQIVINLIANAVKFTEIGGKIAFSVAVKKIRNSSRSRLIMKVADNGCGIAGTVLPHIFEPFVQGDNARNKGGTGLGLSISLNLAKLMGGKITVTSEVGKGSVFTVELPCETVEDENESVIDQDDYNWSGRRALIVEDHPINVLIVQKLLGSKGIKCDIADDGTAAVEMARKKGKGFYSVILMIFVCRKWTASRRRDL